MKNQNEKITIDSIAPDHEKIERDYLAPEIKTEKLLGFGAVCNGSTNGGRKDTTGAPNFCNASRLMS